MYSGGVYLNVLVKGRQIDEYNSPKAGDYRKFIEGRKGSEYAIQIRNQSGDRRKLILSVDGLNVVSGDNNWDRGYVLDPWSTITIPGWRKNGDNVAAFVFSSLKGSYNQHNNSGKAQNVGVIGCRVFNELPILNTYPNNWNSHWDQCRGGIGAGPMMFNNCFGSNGGSGGTWNSTDSAGCSDFLASAQCASNISERPRSAEKATKTPTMGTGWGDNKSFQTREVDYNFYPSPTTTLLMYYHDRKTLIDMGINLREHNTEYHIPEAFPTDGCPPPR